MGVMKRPSLRLVEDEVQRTGYYSAPSGREVRFTRSGMFQVIIPDGPVTKLFEDIRDAWRSL